jgi:hypothetical protein
MSNNHPSNRVIIVADGTEYAIQGEGELVLKNICGAVLTLNSVLYVPEAKNVLSGSGLVQGKAHHVEIDSIGTVLVCTVIVVLVQCYTLATTRKINCGK